MELKLIDAVNSKLLTTFRVKYSVLIHSLYNEPSSIEIIALRIIIHEEVVKIYLVHDQAWLVFRSVGRDYDLCTV